MPRFWEADSLVLIHLKKSAYGPAPPWVLWVVAVVTLTPFLVTLAFFVRGLAGFEPSRSQNLLLLFLIYYNTIHVITHGFARYRLPILPAVLLMILPFVILWVLVKLLPPWPDRETA